MRPKLRGERVTHLLGRLEVVGELGTGVVERVHEHERGTTGATTRHNVEPELLPVGVILLRSAEEALDLVCGRTAETCSLSN